MKYILMLIIFSSNLLFGGISEHKYDYKALDKISTSKLAKIFGNYMAENMPVKIDKVTEVVAVIALGNTIINRKQIDIKDDGVKTVWPSRKESFIKKIFDSESKIICNSEPTKYLVVERNIIFKFNYISKDNEPLFDYTVEKEDCLKIK